MHQIHHCNGLQSQDIWRISTHKKGYNQTIANVLHHGVEQTNEPTWICHRRTPMNLLPYNQYNNKMLLLAEKEYLRQYHI